MVGWMDGWMATVINNYKDDIYIYFYIHTHTISLGHVPCTGLPSEAQNINEYHRIHSVYGPSILAHEESPDHAGNHTSTLDGRGDHIHPFGWLFPHWGTKPSWRWVGSWFFGGICGIFFVAKSGLNGTYFPRCRQRATSLNSKNFITCHLFDLKIHKVC